MTAREPRRLPTWLGEATFQAALIVLSLLLALAADEWRDRRARAERVEVALAAIRQELVANRSAAAKASNWERGLTAGYSQGIAAIDSMPLRR